MQPSPLPSLPPRGVTWPVVFYALVRELPASLHVVMGGIVAIVLIAHTPSGAWEPLVAAIVPGVVAALQRSRPADSDVPRIQGSP